MNVPLKQVVADANQPRKYFDVIKMKSLKESVKKHGIVNPLVVFKEKDHYVLIDGERRFRVATELGFKEVPIVEVKANDPIGRMVEQFHIQEQHEGWTQGEKAQVILDICGITGKSLAEVCDMLGINESVAKNYKAFAALHNRQAFADTGIGMTHAYKIESLKKFFKKVKEDVVGEPFTAREENALEKGIVKRISNGEINSVREYTRIKDTITSNPKLIEKFIDGGEDISTMFVKSKAKAAFHLRNAINSAGYANSHGDAFLEMPNVALEDRDVSTIKRAIKTLQAILDKAGK